MLVTTTVTVLLGSVLVVLTHTVSPVTLPGGWSGLLDGGAYGVLQSAGLLFFAFAGYARVATLGEEVRDPARTIPRAIQLALVFAVALYLLVAITLLLNAGAAEVAADGAPLATAVETAGAAWATPVVRAGAAIASLGALLALVAGLGRTCLAMAREGDLPRGLAVVDPRHRVPRRAQSAVGAVVVVLVLATDLRDAIGFSSFGVLTYYAVANASAYTQTGEHRRWPRLVNVAGLASCVVLVATLPRSAVLTGSAVFALGLLGRLLVRSRGPGKDT